jgi:hypothetical protein
MRRCFLGGGGDVPFARGLVRGEDGRGDDGRLPEPGAGSGDEGRSDEVVGSGDVGAATAVSILRIYSRGSCTAASKIWLIACCNEAGTSACAHCSSSTSLAD